MRRTALLLLAAAGGLCLLVLIAVAIAVATVDLRTLVDPVLAQLRSATGREIALGGPIDLELSLEPRIVLNDVSFGNPAWATGKDMARARRVEARVALLPLLRRRFEVVELALTEPQLVLETDAQGRGNWEFGGASAAPSAPSAPSAGSARPAAAALLAVGTITVEDGTVSYRATAGAKATQIVIEHLRVRTRSGAAPVDAEFRGRINDVALAFSASVGPLDALAAGRWPVALTAKGEIDRKPGELKAKLSTLDDAISFDELDLALGAFKATGRIGVVTRGQRRKYTFDLALPAVAVRDLALPVAAATSAASGGHAAASRRLFSDAPLPLAGLKAFDAAGQLSIAELKVDERIELARLSLRLALDAGKLDIARLSFGALGGNVAGSAALDASRDGAPALRVKLDSRDLDLGAILAAAGMPRQTRGGKTTLAVDLTGSGASPHAWASTASGAVTAVVGPATLVGTKIDVGNAFDALAQAVNPFGKVDPSTELECAVIRLPLAGGVARVDRSIAMETKKLGVSASGTLDFRNETVDLSLRPRIRDGIPIDVPQIAELVRYTGPFTNPRVTIDAVASAQTLAKIGAAIGTGGLSVVGTTLLAQAAGSDNACDVALGRAPPADSGKSPKQPADRAGALPQEIGKALGKIFRR
jgi:uncharacterized protein involved in outer membrane biogenesis